MERVRELVEKAERGQFTKEDLGVLSEATRRALKFMLDKGIPITPKNFEVWFMVFAGMILHNAPDTSDNIDQFYRKVEQFLEEKLREERELREMRRETEEVLNFSADRLGKVLESMDEHDRAIESQLKQIESFMRSGVGSILETLLGEIERLKEVNSRLKRELEDARNTMNTLRKRLAKKAQEAIRDPLTGLYNRGYLEEELKRRIRLFDKKGRSFAVVMADLDHFKRVNDLYGHLAGDHVLVTFASILKNDIRMDDVAARYGGEEFVVVLDALGLNAATSVANRFRSRLESTPIIWGENIIRVTASFGVAQVRAGDVPETILDRADKALYLAKSDGRNCVRSERDLVTRQAPPA